MSSTPTASKRIFGRALYLTIDGTNLAMDVKNVNLSFEDRDASDMTFAEAAAGGDIGTLSLTAIQSTDPASLWRTVWDHRGEEVPFALAVHGNAVPSADQPHVTGTVTIGPRPALGGAADPRTAYEFEVEWRAEVDTALKTTA